jgi:hypothetical protein
MAASQNNKREAAWSIWRQRGRRFATGANVCVSVVLALLFTLMVDYLAYRYYAHWNVSSKKYYDLSDRTKSLISSLKADVNVLVYFRKSHELSDEVKNLLREYDYEAARFRPRRLRIDFVDPDRDLTRARELAQKFDLTDANVVVFTSGGRTKYVEAKEIADYELTFDKNGPVKKRGGFKGEQVFSSAIQSVVQVSSPVVYFLTGHGEHDITDYNEQSGYSSLARFLRRDNVDVRQLQPGENRGIPEDCSALVIAGPRKKFSDGEIDMVSTYLNKSGRLLLLADPGTRSGLEKLFEEWGVRIGQGVVVGYTITGRELVITEYGDHPITRSLKNVTTMFYMPRSVEPTTPNESKQTAQPDKPRVTVLASNTKEGWEESDAKQRPARFDAGIDRRGPISVAVAVEKGLIGDIDVEIKPTRIVVIGDSYFVSNAGLKSAIGGNIDFFMNAMNWLVAREALLAIGVKTPDELHLDMNHDQMRIAFIIIIGAIPSLVAFAGFIVWLGRRR